MKMFWVLFLNIASITAMVSIIYHTDLPHDTIGITLSVLFIVNPIYNIYYSVGLLMPKKDNPDDKKAPKECCDAIVLGDVVHDVRAAIRQSKG